MFTRAFQAILVASGIIMLTVAFTQARSQQSGYAMAAAQSLEDMTIQPLDPAMSVFSQESRRVQALYREIDEHLERGDNSNAVASYDRLFDEFPDYGRDNGVIVTLQYHRAVAHGHEKGSIERRMLFEEIWDEPSYGDYPQIYNIGRMVVSYSFALGDYEHALEHATELTDKLASEYEKFPDTIQQKHGIDTAFQEGLLYAARSANALGRDAQSVANYKELLDRFPNSIFVEECEYEIKRSTKIQTEILDDLLKEVHSFGSSGSIDTEISTPAPAVNLAQVVPGSENGDEHEVNINRDEREANIISGDYSAIQKLIGILLVATACAALIWQIKRLKRTGAGRENTAGKGSS